MAKRGKGKSKGKGKKVRVHFKTNRLTPRRDKGWTQWYREGRFESEDEETKQTLNRKGDLSRKRTIIVDDDDQPTAADQAEQREGIVVAMRGQIADVDDGEQVWPCTIRRILRTRLIEERHPVAVGDVVWFSVVADAEGVEREGVIESVADRKSRLIRRYGDREHTIAANVDQVVIVSSIVMPIIKPHLIDRYLVAASLGGLRPILCINKIDLDTEGIAEELLERFDGLDLDILLTSATDGTNVDALAERLQDRITVLTGQSGTGKSSLINAIQPDLQLRVSDISDENFKGKHTTTTAQLLRLDMGGYVVDTPGIRQFEMAGLEPGELEAHFPDFEPYLTQCKYPDCAHTNESEADCGVKRAVAEGSIHPERYASYCYMLDELIQLDSARQLGHVRSLEND